MPDRSVLQHTGKKFRTHKISKRIQDITVSAIKEMSMLAMQYDDVIPFAWGLPIFPTPENILKAVADATKDNKKIGMYAPLSGLPELRVAAAKTIARKFGEDAEPDPMTETLITVGAMEALMDTLMAIIDPEDEVILTTPGFSSHIEQVMLTGGTPIFVPLIEENQWTLDTNELKKAITPKTKAILICNPGNPTGNILSEEQIRTIANIALEHDLFIISDEPYNFLTYDGKQPFTFIQIPEIRKNLISIFSLSKEYCMTGFRIGYVVAEEGIINQLSKAHDSTVISAPTVSQIAAIEALTGPQDAPIYFRDELQKHRDIMCNRLDRLDKHFSYVKPTGAYYIFAKILDPGPDKPTDAIPLAVDILEKARVSIVPGDAFGPTGKNHVRFCFGTSPEQIEEGFNRLDKYFANS
jgi:aminotransferase